MEDDEKVPRVQNGESEAVGRSAALQEDQFPRGSGAVGARVAPPQRPPHAPQTHPKAGSGVEEDLQHKNNSLQTARKERSIDIHLKQ